MAKNPDFAAAHKKVMKTIKTQVAALRKRKASKRTPKARKATLGEAIGALSSMQRSVGGICQEMGGGSGSGRKASRKRS